MMKKTMFLLCALLCGSAAYAQNNTVAGSAATQHYTALSVSGPIRAQLIRVAAGEAESVVFDSPESGARVKSTCENGQLTLRAPKSVDTVGLRIYYRELDMLDINGADVRLANAVTEPMFDLTVSGGVTFEAEFDVRDLKVEVTGKSLLKLTGRARYFDLTVSTAEVKARGLEVMAATVEASHNAEVRLHVTERLVANAALSMIRYEGTPEIVRGETSLLGGDILPFEPVKPQE